MSLASTKERETSSMSPSNHLGTLRDKFQEPLQNSQAELATACSNRMLKEKTLMKVPKELNNSPASVAYDPMIRTHIFEKMVGSSPCAAIKIDSKVSIKEEEDKARIFRLNKLREQLHTTRAELATERSNRKHKEKSLIKLAKELSTRLANGKRKEKLILEMVETIEDLEIRLTDRNREFAELSKLKARCAKQEAEIDDHERITHQLHRHLEEARSEADVAKGDLIAHLSNQVSSQRDVTGTSGETEVEGVVVPVKTRNSGVHHATTVITFIALIAAALGVAMEKALRK